MFASEWNAGFWPSAANAGELRANAASAAGFFASAAKAAGLADIAAKAAGLEFNAAMLLAFILPRAARVAAAAAELYACAAATALASLEPCASEANDAWFLAIASIALALLWKAAALAVIDAIARAFCVKAAKAAELLSADIAAGSFANWANDLALAAIAGFVPLSAAALKAAPFFARAAKAAGFDASACSAAGCFDSTANAAALADSDSKRRASFDRFAKAAELPLSAASDAALTARELPKLADIWAAARAALASAAGLFAKAAKAASFRAMASIALALFWNDASLAVIDAIALAF